MRSDQASRRVRVSSSVTPLTDSGRGVARIARAGSCPPRTTAACSAMRKPYGLKARLARLTAGLARGELGQLLHHVPRPRRRGHLEDPFDVPVDRLFGCAASPPPAAGPLGTRWLPPETALSVSRRTAAQTSEPLTYSDSPGVAFASSAST